ncbi:MAG: sigma-70 family RNA polymerase sigma factor [Planctomycetales bacterium]|nr:sigma-70 family RNA polymerase sigma factor [Planctomycetales bacterium]
MASRSAEVTVLLHQANDGDARAGSQLFQLVQQQLHQMAESKLAHEPPGTTIQATVLVHDVFLQLMGEGQELDLNDRKHFYVLAAKAMRRILIDRARRRKALKRGGPQGKQANVELDRLETDSNDEEVLDLHQALKRLSEVDPRQAQIVELRHFGGYEVKETADLLNVSPSTVKQEFALAKAWLYRELKRG